MRNVYAIADLHFGHENMAIARGFNSIEEHDNYIIASWNEIVKKHDTVYLIGDITHEKPQFYNLLNQLKGHKKVVLGNHEKLQHIKDLNI
jgi:calcineurin-like phosphoesterase family protein